LVLTRCLVLQAEQLRQHYMTKSNSEVSEAQQALQPVLQNIRELKRKVSVDTKTYSMALSSLYYCMS